MTAVALSVGALAARTAAEPVNVELADNPTVGVCDGKTPPASVDGPTDSEALSCKPA
jgi:hypothetical protein